MQARGHKSDVDRPGNSPPRDRNERRDPTPTIPMSKSAGVDPPIINAWMDSSRDDSDVVRHSYHHQAAHSTQGSLASLLLISFSQKFLSFDFLIFSIEIK